MGNRCSTQDCSAPGKEEPDLEAPIEEEDPISDTAIEAFVAERLEDDDINNKFIPDFIEKRLYKNMMKFILQIVLVTVRKTKIELFGHEIAMTLRPSP
jgi:hypothetical protein